MKSIDEFAQEARIWLDGNAQLRPSQMKAGRGEGFVDFFIFHNLSDEIKKILN